MWRLGTLELDTRAVLAPMASVTDVAYRRLLRELGCGMAYTEFVSADGLVRGGAGSLGLLATRPEERPLGVQLFGSDPEVIARAAAIAHAHTRCDVMDLNMGCWVPKVVKRGAGAALLKDPRRVEAIVAACVKAVPIPVTAKIRAGFCETESNARDIARAIEQGGGAAVTLHARFRSQAHAGAPRWELISELKQTVRIPVIGNGGIQAASDALAMRRQTGCDAVMVGRAAMAQPWIFRQIADLEAGRPAWMPTGAERLAIVERHLRYAAEADQERQPRSVKRRGGSCEGFTVSRLRGMMSHYCAGIPGAIEFRRQLSRIATIEQALAALSPVFARAAEAEPPRPFSEDAACAA